MARSNPAQIVARAMAQLTGGDDTVVTSVRVPVGLREASRTLQAAGFIASFNDLLVQGARDRVEALAHRAGLDAHYAEHPDLRPSLAEVAFAAAQMDANDLAAHPDLITQAAAELVARQPSASADDVLAYAAALLAHPAA